MSMRSLKYLKVVKLGLKYKTDEVILHKFFFLEVNNLNSSQDISEDIFAILN